MLDEILYLESCLSIEKSMFDITEACAEGLGSIDEGFLFESPKDVFATVRDKVIKLIEKVRNIFAGKASKMQEQTVAKKAENLSDATIEVQDASKVKKLYDKAVTSIKSGKDPDKVNDWFKKGLIALGVLTVAGSAAAVGVTKHKKKLKQVKPKNNCRISIRLSYRVVLNSIETLQLLYVMVKKFYSKLQKVLSL